MTIGQVVNLVPPIFLKYREEYIASIVNEDMEDDRKLSLSAVSAAICYLKKIKQLENFGYPHRNLLWKATFNKQLPHMEFIGPPVLECVVCNNQLQIHNPPTSVICFRLSGPLPALKITLRCRSCCLNYR